MKSIIQMALVGGLLFGAAFAASYFLFLPKPAETTEQPEEMTTANADLSTQPETPAPDPATVDKSEALPVAFRASEISAQAAHEIFDSITKKERALEQRERLLSKDELRLKTLQKDLDRERSELKAYSEQLEQKMLEVAQLLEDIKTENAGLQTLKQELESQQKKQVAPSVAEATAMAQRAAPIRKLLESADPEVAATLFKQMADDGDLDLAAFVLNALPSKQGMGILQALNDPVLGKQLLDALPKSPAPPK